MTQIPSSDRGQRRRRTGISSVFFALFLSTSMLLAGCFSYQRQGDRAFERGDCVQALDAYQQAVDSGATDSRLFHRAAKCSMRFGDFAAAERHYSQALRYGAGADVARELADFYVRTSNYISAVRVYQFLLHREAEKQPVYNNLGTALMYAGQAFDAESYLMIAQQMKPEDPTPYVNLGLLYDRHLKQPWLAINFYQCYLELAPSPGNADAIRQRISELRGRYDRLYEPEAVSCGESYEPASSARVAVEDLREVVGTVQIESEEPGRAESQPETEGDGQDGRDVETTDAIEKTAETESTGVEVAIDRMVEEDAAPAPTAEETTRGVIAQGRHAYEQGNWSEAVARFTAVPIARLTDTEKRLLGLSYLRQANWTAASQWLEMARTTGENEEVIEGLFEAYQRMGDDERVRAMCKKYAKSAKYESIVDEYCATQSTETTD